MSCEMVLVTAPWAKTVIGFDYRCAGEVVGKIGAVKRRVDGRTAWIVRDVTVPFAHRRKGVATKLYEALAQAVCAKRGRLVSYERTEGAHSTDFWEKQVRKGRAEIIGRKTRGTMKGPIYELSCAHASDLSGLRKKKAAKSRRRK